MNQPRDNLFPYPALTRDEYFGVRSRGAFNLFFDVPDRCTGSNEACEVAQLNFLGGSNPIGGKRTVISLDSALSQCAPRLSMSPEINDLFHQLIEVWN